MSVEVVPPRRPTAVPAPGAPAPRAVIDYDFETVLTSPPKQRLVLWLFVGLLVVAGIAVALARVDIVVAANGKLATSASEILVQPIDTGVVRQIAVTMGEKVEKGAVLARLDPTFAAADETALTAKLGTLQAKFDRLAAEIAGRPYAPEHATADEATERDVFLKRGAEYRARLDAVAHKVDQLAASLAARKTEAHGLKEEIALAGQTTTLYSSLVERNLASKLRLFDAKEHLVEAQARLDADLGQQHELAAQIAAAGAERDAFVSEWNRKLAEAMAQTRAEREAAAAELQKARLRHRLSVLRAPAAGTVLWVADRPEGSVVRPAEPLVRLVPKDAPLVAVVRIETRDVARLKLGDTVTLKFEALPWQQFGLVKGTLTALAPDTQSDSDPSATAQEMSEAGMRNAAHESLIHYRARVALTKAEFRNLPAGFALRPGMRVLAEIKVGRRSVLEYILNPLTRVFSDSLREP
ncbi:MAG TPA: HlyD family type I secretion periplasmic adaptor subunit [Stellaceae bacterium]|nr:HlyD family type I secretion periplasmic adaptor subunit [Stellaceae bacterium]